MSAAYDHDFQPLVAKAVDVPYSTERPTSRLAVTSMVFGILGVTALPLLGSIVAVATGHAALGQIRESGGRLEGRPIAKVGLGLGYFQIVLALIAGLVLLGIFVVFAPMAVQTATMATPAPFEVAEVRGVKMVNEMDRADYKLIENHHLNNAEGEIIACYTAGKGSSNPELALLTTRNIVYLKDGNATSFDLKNVTGLMDDNAYQQAYLPLSPNYADYYIEVRSKTGPRMRIIIQPKPEGSAFYEAIADALKQAGVTISTH